MVFKPAASANMGVRAGIHPNSKQQQSNSIMKKSVDYTNNLANQQRLSKPSGNSIISTLPRK